MAALSEMLRPSEAAVVASVSLRDINRVIDEHILPDAFVSVDNGRRILAAGCSLIAFYFESARHLTSEERLLAIRTAEARLVKVHTLPWARLLREDFAIHRDFLTIDLMPFIRSVGERLDDLQAARAIVESSPEILGGVPVIRGTRVPVYDIAATLAAGYSADEVVAAWPSLDLEKVRLATIYANANPQRGRPPASRGVPEGTTIVTDRKIVRHRKAG